MTIVRDAENYKLHWVITEMYLQVMQVPWIQHRLTWMRKKKRSEVLYVCFSVGNLCWTQITGESKPKPKGFMYIGEGYT